MRLFASSPITGAPQHFGITVATPPAVAELELLPPGARVTVRSDLWTVETRTPYVDCEAVRVRGVSGTNRRSTRTLLHPYDRLIPVVPGRPRVVRSHAWTRSVLAALADRRPFGSVSCAAAADIHVLPFQLEPALAMLRHGHTRVLIADEVGLGKTIQAALVLAHLANDQESFRALVLVPASLLDQWIAELSDRFHVTAVKADSTWLAGRSRALPPDVNPWSLPGTYVASIDFIKRPEVLRPLEDVTWDVIVVDEAHGAGIASARRAAADAIATRSRRVLLLTATPPDGDPQQLDALRQIGSLGDSIVEFRRTRRHIGHPAKRRTVLLAVRLSSAERRMHRLLGTYTSRLWKCGGPHAPARLIAMLLQKRALSSASALARSLSRRLQLLDGEEPADTGQLLLPLTAGDALDDDVRDSVLGAKGLADPAEERRLLLALGAHARSAARRESKLLALQRLLRRVREPAIVFTEFRDTLRHLEDTLAVAGHPSIQLHGGMNPHERAAAVRAFHQGAGLLLATDAASEGLNLHHTCRLVVHFELPWTPSRVEQRTGRVDRLGQSRTAHEVLMVARHTAERLVLVPLLRRARAAAAREFHRNSALSALTESNLAAGILEGVPIPEPLNAATKPRVVEYEVEASAEAQRVQLERRLRHLARAAAPPDGLLITGRRPRQNGGIVIVVEVVLRGDPAASPMHSSVIAIRLHARSVDLRTHSDLREFADRFLLERRAFLEHAICSLIAGELNEARDAYKDAIDRVNGRDRALQRALPSTARRLVQAGLFDKRAVRAAERQRETAAALVEELDARMHRDGAPSALLPELKVLAIRIPTQR